MCPTIFERYGASELGTTKFVAPQYLPNSYPPPAFVPMIGQRGTPVTLLHVSCDDACATPVTVSIRSEYDLDPNTGSPTIGGPIVGTILWGVGGGENQLEFDVPSARVPDQMAPPGGTFPNAQMALSGNGVMIYLSGASHVTVSVRNDGSLGPLTSPLGPYPIGYLATAKVIGFIAPSGGGSFSTKLTRTIIIANDSHPLLVGHSVDIAIPPMASSVRILRAHGSSGSVEPVSLLLRDSAGLYIYHREFLGSNDCREIPLHPFVGFITVENSGANDAVQMAAVFTVTPI